MSWKGRQPPSFHSPNDGRRNPKITAAPAAIEQFAWRPAAEIATSRPTSRRTKRILKASRCFEVGDNDFLATEAALPSHIWIVAAQGGTAKRLTSGAWSLPKSAPPSFPGISDFLVSGRKWLFHAQELRSGDADLTTLQVLNAETGEIRKLTKHRKIRELRLFSPDGPGSLLVIRATTIQQ